MSLAEREKISRSAGAKLIEDGAVLVNSKTVAKNYKVRENDIIDIFQRHIRTSTQLFLLKSYVQASELPYLLFDCLRKQKESVLYST